MEVVDRQQQRALGGEVGGQPEQAVERGERRDGLLAGVGRTEHGRGGRGRPGERGGIDLALEELAHDAEAELALQLAGAGGEDGELARRRGAQAGEQARLPDPGRTLDQQQAPAPGDGIADGGVEHRELGVALQQRHAVAIAPASSRRERTPSLRYALERWTSTVFGVTNSACAMSRFVSPDAARSTIRRSDAVSAPTPAWASVRGRVPVA